MRNTFRQEVLAYADLLALGDEVHPAEVAWKLRSLAGEQCSEHLCKTAPEDGYSTCERHTSESYLRQYG